MPSAKRAGWEGARQRLRAGCKTELSRTTVDRASQAGLCILGAVESLSAERRATRPRGSVPLVLAVLPAGDSVCSQSARFRAAGLSPPRAGPGVVAATRVAPRWRGSRPGWDESNSVGVLAAVGEPAGGLRARTLGAQAGRQAGRWAGRASRLHQHGWMAALTPLRSRRRSWFSWQLSWAGRAGGARPAGSQSHAVEALSSGRAG